MKRLFSAIIFCVLCLAHYAVFAQSISGSELIDNAQQYDGKSVSYTGEVIGDIMLRGEYAWINVNDGTRAIGVWAGASLIEDIVHAGSYRAKGDIVEITGVFHRACPEHGGDLDIHARRILIITPGARVVEKSDIEKRKVAVALLGALGLIWILTKLKIR